MSHSIAAISVALVRTVRFQRVATWIVRRQARLLAQVRNQVLAGLVSRGSLFSPQLVVRGAMQEVRSDLERSFAAMELLLDDRRGVRSDFSLLGASWKDWLSRSFESLAHVVDAQARMLFATDRAASVPVNFLEREFNAALHGLDTLVRTAVVALANSVQPVPAAGQELVQVSVLDARTSDVCRRYAGRRWSIDHQPIGHRLPFYAGPPRHWGCRSSLLLVPSGDGASLRDFGVDDWLKLLGDAEADRLFGANQMRLYRRGDLPLSDLVRQADRPLAVRDLR